MFSSAAPNAAAAREREEKKWRQKGMYRNRERRGTGEGERRQGGKRLPKLPILLSEVFLLEDGGIAGGM